MTEQSGAVSALLPADAVADEILSLKHTTGQRSLFLLQVAQEEEFLANTLQKRLEKVSPGRIAPGCGTPVQRPRETSY